MIGYLAKRIELKERLFMKVLIKFSTVDGKQESSLDQVRLTTYGSNTAEHLGYFFVELMNLCKPVKKREGFGHLD